LKKKYVSYWSVKHAVAVTSGTAAMFLSLKSLNIGFGDEVIVPDDDFPNSTAMSKKAIWLPSAFTLSDEDINTVCDHIKEFIEK